MPSLAAPGAFLLATFLLCGTLAPAATSPLPAPSADLDLQRLPAAGWLAKERLDAIAAQASNIPLSAQVAGLAGVAIPEPEAPSATLAEALSRLAVQAGHPADVPQPPAFDALPPGTQATLLALVDGVREAARRVDAAFAGLTPAERAELLDGLLELDQPAATPEQAARLARLEGLAARVDAAALRAAGAALLQAAERAPPLPPAEPAPAAPAAPAPPPAGGAPGGFGALAFAQTCFTSAPSIVDFTGMVEVGMAGPNSYFLPRALVLEIAGNDCYQNYPASFGPGLGPLPVGLIVDASGDDEYYAYNSIGPPGTVYGIGVGIGGIGIVADRNGDDVYDAYQADDPLNCGFPYALQDSWQRIYTQGVGILGVGAVADTSGNDRYLARNSHTAVPTVPCSFSHVYTYAQGVGARLGVGVLADETGDEVYQASTVASGKAYDLAHTHAQAAASGRAVALLQDEEGQDSYEATAEAAGASWVAGRGDSAYTFAQGVLYGTNEPRDETLGTDLKEIGVSTAVSVGCDAFHFEVLTPVGPAGASQPCDLHGAAVLSDILGSDEYLATADADDSGFGCGDGVWAGVVAQGAAPAKGVGGVADLGLDEPNSFVADAYANGRGCAPLGVRAGTYAQGFGGAILWDHWDAPPFDPLLVTDLSVGVLSRGGDCGVAPPQVVVTPTPPFVVVVSPTGGRNHPCPQAWASDTYKATAHADQDGAGPSWARTFAQGAASGKVSYKVAGTSPDPAYDALGLGVHADVFGYDRYGATATSDDLAGAADAFTVAQGAGYGGYGVLANVEGQDDYHADAKENGPSLFGQVLAQADGAPLPVSVTVCTPGGFFCNTSTANPGGGIFVDAVGNDSYYPGVPNGKCPADSVGIPALRIWGSIVTFPPCPQGAVHVVGIDVEP